uniref:ELMO domain-containing protein n=1 Tax=Globisporangium ultimum (strain ATCC 200006 / CBS 805.95 / DAOM BR144) TaxID=431595 RepID=K3X4G9_GLOUD
MTASAVVRRAARKNEGFVRRIWRWVKNALWQVLFGQSEVQRICTPTGNQVDEQSRIVRFRTSLALSNALVKICNAVFDFEAFPMEAILTEMIKRLSLDAKNTSLIANVRGCLDRCNYVNRVYNRVHALRDEAFDSKNAKHEEMLEQLWSNLKPNVRRSGGRITKEWGEIGFQGTDPMSDFRGMGIFSLYQLLHFTGNYPVEAQAALAESNHPTRWYPFSVTGINITSFIIELINERLVDFKLYKFANLQRGTNDSSNEDDGLEALHELYSTIFTRFNKLWVDSNPRDVMAFPTIFNALKKTIRKELVKHSFNSSKMGGRTTGKKNLHSKKKGYKRSHATKSRARDIDQIQDDMKLEQVKGKPMEFEKDEDLPGLGQFYCTPCARHFIDAVTRDVHLKTKVHKRRMKDVAQKQYTQKEAELGAGKTVEKYTPAHPKESGMDDL